MAMTLTQTAQVLGCSYEAVRQNFKRYKDKELQGHFQTVGRTTTIDDYAVEFLRSLRATSPIVIEQQEQSEKVEELNEQLKAALFELHSIEKEYREYTIATAPKIALAEFAESLKERAALAEQKADEQQQEIERLQAELQKERAEKETQALELEKEKTRSIKFGEFWKRRK